MRVVAGPTGNVVTTPHPLKVRRKFASGANDIVATGIELFLQPCAIDIFEGVFLHQLLGGLLVIGTAAKVEFHPVEKCAV